MSTCHFSYPDLTFLDFKFKSESDVCIESVSFLAWKAGTRSCVDMGVLDVVSGDNLIRLAQVSHHGERRGVDNTSWPDNCWRCFMLVD